MKENNEIFTKILYCLYIIIALFVLNCILLTVSIGTKGNDNVIDSSGNNDEVLEYDVSKFTEMTTDQALQAIQSSDMQVIYIGRSGCSYCRMYIPILQAAQNEFGYKTIYIDLDKVTTTDSEKLSALDSLVAEKFGYTPMTILAKDGQYIAGHVGYMEYSELKSFLEANGL